MSIKSLVYKRRARLVKKWKKNIEFKKRSIGDKFECEFLSLVPTDGEEHVIELTVRVTCSKDKPTKSKHKIKLDGKEVNNINHKKED